MMGIAVEPAVAYHRDMVWYREPDGEEVMVGFAAILVAAHLFFHFIGNTPLINARGHYTSTAQGALSPDLARHRTAVGPFRSALASPNRE
ncbi:MAG: hypothetical protein H0U21_14035 [Acidimicrobiia bacterium]|nr:hypothetical protein [Acidimicrobiia bacterium]